MTLSQPYVLVAEDDHDDVEFFSSVFTGRFPQILIRHISNGYPVLAFFDSCPVESLPSLLILDYKMPLTSAPAILRSLLDRAHLASMPRAVWSTTWREAEIEECRLLGAHHFFDKPASEKGWDALVSELGKYFRAGGTLE